MEAVNITLEMIANAPARERKARGRQKGSSPVEKDFRGWYAGTDAVFGRKLSTSEMQALRTAVNRTIADEDTSKVGPYRAALESAGITETILSEEGEGSDKRFTLALSRVVNEDNN
jgi:hypothetical protein